MCGRREERREERRELSPRLSVEPPPPADVVVGAGVHPVSTAVYIRLQHMHDSSAADWCQTIWHGLRRRGRKQRRRRKLRPRPQRRSCAQPALAAGSCACSVCRWFVVLYTLVTAYTYTDNCIWCNGDRFFCIQCVAVCVSRRERRLSASGPLVAAGGLSRCAILVHDV